MYVNHSIIIRRSIKNKYIYIYIYIYTHMCVCVCVCIRNKKTVGETWTKKIFMKHIQGVSIILGETSKLILHTKLKKNVCKEYFLKLYIFS
jgi:hypothetical protein